MPTRLCPNCSAALSLENQLAGRCDACGGPLLPQSRLQAAATRLAAAHAGIPVPKPAAPGLPLFIDCPMCGQPTGNLKCYEMGIVVFLGCAVSWNIEGELGCPRCIRWKLLVYTLINLLTANVLWPIVILPINLIHLVASFCPGHSRKVADRLQEGSPG
jgi:hypothetical protein